MRDSAYTATLATEDGISYLLTPGALHRMLPGSAPTRWELPLGSSPVLATQHLIYWDDGIFRSVPSAGGQPKSLASVTRAPRHMVGSKEHWVWLDRTNNGRFSINTLEGSRARVVHSTSDTISATAMDGELVYFVERAADNSWRLGLVALSSSHPYYALRKRGRTPAMLVAAGDLFYYDGPSLTLRRVSPDLHQEDVIAGDVICSPLAVAEHVYCAQPAGVIEIGRDGTRRRAFSLGHRGTVTAISATAERVLWVLDIGAGELAVESVALEPRGASR